jgi:hypothetical protein
MTRIEWFIYASFKSNGTTRAGYRFNDSPALRKWITDDELTGLKLQGSKKETRTCTPLSNGKIAFSYLKPTVDEINRHSFYNCTLVFRLVDLLTLLNAENVIDKYFVKEMDVMPEEQLEALEV